MYRAEVFIHSAPKTFKAHYEVQYTITNSNFQGYNILINSVPKMVSLESGFPSYMDELSLWPSNRETEFLCYFYLRNLFLATFQLLNSAAQ